MTASVDLDYQVALENEDQKHYYLPVEQQVKNWVEATLQSLDITSLGNEVQLTVRVVGKAEMIQLNSRFRDKQSVTNVLSFPFEPPEGVSLPLLGDVVVCAAVVSEEARQQSKRDEQHWAHMVIHGVLHLLGYDHVEENDALCMESVETTVLSKLGFADPYGELNTL